MTLDELKAEVADIVSEEPAAITDAAGPDSIAGWDSTAALSLISLIEEHVEDGLTTEEVDSIRDFGSLIAVAKSKGVLGDG